MEPAQDISVRAAQGDDFEAVRALFHDLHDLHHKAAPDRLKPADMAPLTANDFERNLRDHTQIILVAEQGAHVIAYIRAVARDRREGAAYRVRCVCIIEEIVTHRDFRRLGVGRKLMRAAHKWAVEQNAKSIELGVFAFNADARSFYQALGFAEQAVRLSKPL